MLHVPCHRCGETPHRLPSACHSCRVSMQCAGRTHDRRRLIPLQDQKLYDTLPEPDDDENDMLDLAYGLTET